jgi:hypothetical protein
MGRAPGRRPPAVRAPAAPGRRLIRDAATIVDAVARSCDAASPAPAEGRREALEIMAKILGAPEIST